MAFLQDVQTGVQIQPSANGLETFIHLSQGENGRKLYIKILGIDEIPTGSVATISGTKPDGNVYSAAGIIDDITIVFNEDIQMTVVAGIWDANVKIVNEGNVIASAKLRFVIHESAVASGAVPSGSQLDGIVAECQMYAEAARSAAYGSPLTASAAADMIDTSKVYVYTGDETGYTAGHWYYYNGTAWADGGVYNSMAIQTDTTLTLPDHAADAKATGDTLAEKADKDGVIATAEGLIGGAYITEKEPYHFRKTAVDLAGRLDETIVGGSLAWNQLCNGSSVTVQSGHKYIAKISGAFSIGASTGTAITGLTSGTDMVTDLTTLFGNSTIADYIYSLEQANAGAGVAWVKKYIDLDTYHEYDAGSIRSVEGLESHDVVGFNQWDEETIFDDNGFVKQSDGSWYLDNLSNVSLGKFFWINKSGYAGPIYFQYVYKNVNSSGSQGGRFKWVYSDGTSSVIYANPVTSFTLMTSLSPVNKTVVGLVWDFGSSANSTWFKEVIVNFSDPSRNGTYEPYEKHSYPLDPTVKLNGVFKLVGDHLEADGDRWYSNKGIERRYGLVVLDGTQNNFGVSAVNDFAQVSWNGYNNIGVSKAIFVSDKFTYADSVSGAEGRIYPSNSASRMFLGLPSTVTTAAQAQAWFASNPTTVIYPLATPTTETAQPYQSPMIVGATEEYVTTGVVPVGHESKYYEDVAKKVSGLPKDFSTLIAPTEATFTATRNYSVGNYLIVKNQLYKVTSAISSGGTITPNSNVTATTIMAEILALA